MMEITFDTWRARLKVFKSSHSVFTSLISSMICRLHPIRQINPPLIRQHQSYTQMKLDKEIKMVLFYFRSQDVILITPLRGQSGPHDRAHALYENSRDAEAAQEKAESLLACYDAELKDIRREDEKPKIVRSLLLSSHSGYLIGRYIGSLRS